MYQLAITRDFIARHYLTGGDWGAENQEHSHHYRVEILVSGKTLDQHGYLIDIVELEEALNGIIDIFRECTLNDLEPFRGLNPSLEHFARIFSEMLSVKLPLDDRSLVVKLWENANDWASYRG